MNETIPGANTPRWLADQPTGWRGLGRILLYPFETAPFATVLMLVILLRVGMQGLWGLPLLVIGLPWTLSYLDSIIERTASGRVDPPLFGTNHVGLANLRGWRPALLPLVWFWLWWEYADSQPQTIAALTSVGLFLLPAYLLCCAIGGLPAALNPIRIVRVAIALGPAYLLLAAIPIGLALWLQSGSHGGSTVFIMGLLAYTLVAAAHGIGVLAWRRADQLGFFPWRVISTRQQQAQAAEDRRHAAILRMVHTALERQDPAAARAALSSAESDVVDPAHFAHRLFSALYEGTPRDLLLHQARRTISLYLQSQRPGEALKLTGQCVDLYPRFVPDDADLPALVDAARLMGDTANFDRCSRCWDAVEPVQPDIAMQRLHWLLETQQDDAARALYERLDSLLNSTHPLRRPLGKIARVLGKA